MVDTASRNGDTISITITITITAYITTTEYASNDAIEMQINRIFIWFNNIEKCKEKKIDRKSDGEIITSPTTTSPTDTIKHAPNGAQSNGSKSTALTVLFANK